MEYQGNNEGINPQKFDDMIEMQFENWFQEYKKQNSSNVESFRAVLFKAYKSGWLNCEDYYLPKSQWLTHENNYS